MIQYIQMSSRVEQRDGEKILKNNLIPVGID